MNRDLDKGITNISYNLLNLPARMDMNASTSEATTRYTYSASGQKLKVHYKWSSSREMMHVTGSDLAAISGTLPNESNMDKEMVLNYIGNKVYEDGKLKMILLGSAYYDNTENNYYFYIQDHLGNNRIVADASGAVLQSNQYYPFEMEMETGDFVQQTNQPYKYNNKELDAQNNLNWYDYSARWKADWFFPTQDPLSEQYYSISPYAYVANNPMKFIDPTGMSYDWYQDVDDENKVLWYPGDDLLLTFGDKKYVRIGETYTYNSGNTSITYDQLDVSAITWRGATSDIWVTQMDGSPNQNYRCYDASKIMLSNAGVEPDGLIMMTNLGENGRAGTPAQSFQKGLEEIDNTIKGGNPIMVGADTRSGTSSKSDGMSDHFLVITEATKTFDKSGRITSQSYRFLDARTGSKSGGTHPNNKLSVQNNYLKGSFRQGANVSYTIVSVRTNKK